MSILTIQHHLTRIKKIHALILNRETGCSEEFAEKVGISRSVLMKCLKEMKSKLSAPISFDRENKTFYYHAVFEVEIFISANNKKIFGGRNYNFHQIEDLKWKIPKPLIRIEMGRK